jgi:uncharacterized protein (TIGR02145 family)
MSWNYIRSSNNLQWKIMSFAFTSPQRFSLRAISVSMVLLALVFITSCKKDDDATDTPPGNNQPTLGIDQEGDAFISVIIGSQEWMSQNLSTAIYADGTPIPQVTDPNEWAALTTGAWCWCNNDSATYAAIYGRLYNWYAVAGIYDAASAANPALRKQLAPMGWHVPSDSEWSTMINFLDPSAGGGSIFTNLAGGLMKTTGTIEDGTGLWLAPNLDASNASGFSGVPRGMRNSQGTYWPIGIAGLWWSSSDYGAAEFAWLRQLNYDYAYVNRYNSNKSDGMSVRCIRE